MVFAYPNALFPFMAVELHAPWATGLMFAAPSVGAFAVSATSEWMGLVRRHGLAIAISAALWGVAMAGFGLSPDIYVALAFLAAAGGADETSGIFRDTLWKQTIPDHLRGRMAGIELLSYAAGPPAGQLRSGVVAAAAGLRFSLISGGLACVAAVAVVCRRFPHSGPTSPLPLRRKAGRAVVFRRVVRRRYRASTEPAGSRYWLSGLRTTGIERPGFSWVPVRPIP